MFKLNKKMITLIGAAFISLIVVLSTFGVNDNGWRTVVQWPNGTTFVKFTPGMYLSLFGTTESYPDELTFDYEGGEVGTSGQNGIKVRYQDGGTGTTYGKLRVKLPTDEATMLKLHRSVRSKEGLANRIIQPIVKEAHNMTAGLMTSEAAYAEKRGTYIQWVDAQLRNGKFVTELIKTDTTDEAGKTVEKLVPRIKVDSKTGQPLHTSSVFEEYGITIGSSPITDWDFEQKTLDQISEKRKATMAIITAKANAERAKQDAITAEQQGLADVMKARYEKEVIKVQSIVDAERAKEVAVIDAKKQVEVAKQTKLQNEQTKFAMMEYEAAEKARGRGDAAYKKMVMEADGALQAKLNAYVEVQKNFAREFGKQKWVPEFAMGTTATDTNGSAATDLIQLLNAKAARDLSLDLQMKGMRK